MLRICFTLWLLVASTLALSDFEALLELKKGIENDPSGKVMASWDSKSVSSDMCPHNWYGVTCSDGHVTSIDLSDLGLMGNFSFPVIAGLRRLLNVSIPNNNFTGTITKIGAFDSLKHLDLSDNMFYGVLPSGTANLKNLELLNLSSNRFEGMVSSGFRKLEQLKYIDLHDNSFSGDVMRLLSELGDVAYVDISENSFSGTLDLALGQASFVSSIQHLNVSHNSLTGQIFAHDGMPFFDSLEVFDASNNRLEGSVPSFNFIVSLRILRLGGNLLSGSIPKGLLQESSTVLSELDLSLNQLEGTVGSITSATLRKLNLSSNKLSGLLPLRAGHCAVIDLSNNKLSGNLSWIQTWGNYVEVMQLSSNSLTGIIPNQTSQFLRLTSFKVSNNTLQGDLPSVLGTYPELTEIDLSFNQLSGPLVPNLFTSAKLVSLNLSGNNFSGSIPLQDIQGDGAPNFSLVNLDLSRNSLAGYLPEQLSRFHNLLFLDLSNNKFEGSIPTGFSGDLKGFNVAFNNLSGIVPGELRQFPDSAFHPGNPLLILPGSPSSSRNGPDLTLGKQGSHMKPSVKAALVAGLVCGAVLVAVLFILIYYSVWKQPCSMSEKRKKSVEKKDSYSVPHSPEPKRNVDPSLSSLNLLEDSMPTTQKCPGESSQNTSSSVKEPNNLANPELVRKDELPSSPVSIMSSSTPSPSKSRLYYDSPVGLKVHTADKLAGELHLFDSSVQFTAEELSHAPAEAIGRSCHGTLYRATLDSGYVLTVKWLREGIAKGKKEFAREVRKLGSIKHPNLVSLLAYYWGPKEHEKLMISEYINAHCLARYLQGTNTTQPRKLPSLSLDERLTVALDVARCLNYLHNERAIPHGNLKSTNILLEAPNLNARLTDYSLHRILTPSATAEQVLNAAALGYRPPEFASSSKPCPSLKSDVYAFGVVLMELLTGKSSSEIVSSDPGIIDLTDWVRLLAEENCSNECFDQTIVERSNVHDPSRVLSNVLQVALKCILPASERPDIKSIFEELSLIV